MKNARNDERVKNLKKLVLYLYDKYAEDRPGLSEDEVMKALEGKDIPYLRYLPNRMANV